MLKYFGVLTGSSLAPAGIHDRESVLQFDSLDHARRHLACAHVGANTAMYVNGAKTLDGEYPGDIPGGAGEGAALTLWTVPNRGAARVFDGADANDLWGILTADPDPYPDYQLEVGPRGGIRAVQL
jgi:hypothetical protein